MLCVSSCYMVPTPLVSNFFVFVFGFVVFVLFFRSAGDGKKQGKSDGERSCL